MKRKAGEDLDDNKKEPKVEAVLEKKDLGHRHGNYHNYYSFHPPSHRLDKMKDILTYIGDKYNETNNPTFQYCDLGCNEGDLTIEIADALQQELQDTRIHFLGIDMDDVLIQRARKKPISNNNVTGEFQTENVCKDLNALLTESVDMTSLLSTTMWIHVHAGDEGLRQVLEQACLKTKQFLLIEPQPSKCYKRAVKRLRKMGRPELDVSSDRLKLRPNIEEEIDAILQSCGFHKVVFPSAEKTQWDRTLQLYERATKGVG